MVASGTNLKRYIESLLEKDVEDMDEGEAYDKKYKEKLRKDNK